MELKDKQIVVIGMGRTGVATAGFLADRGARVILVDHKSRAELAKAVRGLNPAVQTRFAFDSTLPEADLIIPSPGVDFQSPWLEPARRKGTPILSEIELAARFARAPIIAVTGTNGKSTVTTLIGDILNQAGKQALVGGNIGTPLISLVDQPTPDYLVVEVSSFQLEGVTEFHPNISLVLNITPDHMDRHKTFERYVELKGRIAANQSENDWLVLNQDDPRVLALGNHPRARKAFFSTTSAVEEGVFMQAGVLVTRHQGTAQEICAVRDLKQNMQWQVENVLPAAAVGILAGVSAESIAETVKSFSGLEHRMEWVRTFRGIDFVNDSKGTNVGSVRKSLNTFNRRVILIAGGQDKGGDFAPLKNVFKKKVKHMVLLGEAKPKIRQVLNGTFSYDEVDSLEEAVRQAVSKAESGDVVLLSPACASFDMFEDYADRGRRFKAIVNGL